MAKDLLQKLKLNRGVMISDNSLDDYYQEILEMAKAEFSVEDISDVVLESTYGEKSIIYCANLIIDKKDLATDPSLILRKNTLSSMTKGEESK